MESQVWAAVADIDAAAAKALLIGLLGNPGCQVVLHETVLQTPSSPPTQLTVQQRTVSSQTGDQAQIRQVQLLLCNGRPSLPCICCHTSSHAAAEVWSVVCNLTLQNLLFHSTGVITTI